MTDHLYTYPLFTYVCGQMEWSATRSGKHAVVGYNGHGDALYNHPASGFDVIADQIACRKSTSTSKKKRITENNNNNGRENPPITRECRPKSHCDCTTLMNEYRDQQEKVMMVRDATSPCPPTKSQAVGDPRFIKQPNTTPSCYVSTFPEELSTQGGGYTITKQCCYSSR